VGCGGDGDGIASEVKVPVAEVSGDGREVCGDEMWVEVPHGEVDGAVIPEVAGDGAGYDVTWEEGIDYFVVSSIEEERALAPEGFAQEVGGPAGHIEGGGVELHELKVCEGRAGLPRQIVAEAGVAEGIGGAVPKSRIASRGENHGLAFEIAPGGCYACYAAMIEEELADRRMVDDADVGVEGGTLDEGG
jgi:hypothetical protein